MFDLKKTTSERHLFVRCNVDYVCAWCFQIVLWARPIICEAFLQQDIRLNMWSSLKICTYLFWSWLDWFLFLFFLYTEWNIKKGYQNVEEILSAVKFKREDSSSFYSCYRAEFGKTLPSPLGFEGQGKIHHQKLAHILFPGVNFYPLFELKHQYQRFRVAAIFLDILICWIFAQYKRFWSLSHIDDGQRGIAPAEWLQRNHCHTQDLRYEFRV